MRAALLAIVLSFGHLYVDAQLVIRSDGTWKAVGSFQSGWTNPWFNDDAWTLAQSPSPWTISPIVPGSQSMWVTPFSDTAYFRKSFFLKGECVSSNCQISADNEFELYLNDSLVGIGRNLGLIYSFNLTPFLRIGKNTIAIKAANWNTGPYLVSFLANVDYTSSPEIQMSDNDTLCPGTPTNFTVYQNYNSYQWSNGDTSQTITVDEPDIYFVEAIDQNGCKWVDTARLINYNLQNLLLGANRSICEGDTVLLSLSGYSSYSWNTESTDSSIVIERSGTYGVEAIDTNGCMVSDSMNVRVFNFAEISLGPDRVLCKGDTAKISASFPQSIYKWNTGSQKSEIIVSESGVYRVTITNFCGSASDAVEINFTDLSTFEIIDDTLLCDGASIELSANVANAKYRWTNGDSSESIIVDQPGTYGIEVFDNCGNSAYDEVNIYREADYSVLIPTAFTPNLDGINEGYRSFIPKDRSFEMEIFDRWGRLLFSTNDPEEYWDGTYEGSDMPSGTYVYEISYIDCLYQPQLANGTITLVR